MEDQDATSKPYPTIITKTSSYNHQNVNNNSNQNFVQNNTLLQKIQVISDAKLI